MRIDTLKTQIVKHIPDKVESGVLYISKEYKCASHLCPCGCGNEIITPLGEDGWNIEFHDDDTVSLSPSVGNFQLPCRSHYFIKRGKIQWCR